MTKISALCAKLLSFAASEGGVPYSARGKASTEPTLFTLLALLAAEAPLGVAKNYLSWIQKLQNQDGSVGVNSGHRNQGLWLTGLSAVVFHHYGLMEARQRALQFLLSLKSVTVPNTTDVRQDSTLTGWPWIPGTFGWVEPTAWSLIALHLAGLSEHPRAVEGRKFLLDRQIPSGGWNYGNPDVNKKELLPFWDTTGLALTALAGRAEAGRVKAGLDILDRRQNEIESLCGLSWAVLGLQSHGREAGRMKRRLWGVMESISREGLNVCHFAAGLIALSNKKVFTS